MRLLSNKKELTSREKVSLSRKSLRSESLQSTGWLAIFCMHCSSATRRWRTNCSSNRLRALFSGTGGTTTPGLFMQSVSYSQRKSEYRRRTENEDLWNKGEVVWKTPDQKSCMLYEASLPVYVQYT